MVFIKSLRLKGFKSFKDSNVLFKNGFVAIAGPNGSGKSNIIDAIRFAFGETSLKSLRIKKISHLVNNTSREATVTLVLDTNKNNSLEHKSARLSSAHAAGQAQCEQLELKRLINPLGKAKYKVNGKNIKRYAMLDVIRPYNLVPGEHNVIAQGMVQKFVEMNAKERRAIIDNVAGIAEFDMKKNEAVRELEVVQRRINDANIVLAERDGYLNELEKEKEEALKYKDAENMYKRSRGSLIHINLDKSDKQLNKLMSRYVSLKKKKNEHMKDIALLEKRISELSLKKDKIVNEINETSEQKEYMTQLEKLRIQINVDGQKIILIKEEIERLGQEHAGFDTKITNEHARFDEISRSLWKFEKELKESQHKLKAYEKIEDDDSVSTIEMQLENYTKKEKKLIESQGRFDAEIKGYEQLLSAYSSQTLSPGEIKKMKNEFAESQEKIKAIKNDIEKLFQNEKELNNRLPDIDRSILGIKEKIADLRPFIGRRVNPALPFIETLKKKIKGIHGPVIDLIEFDDVYSPAVSAAAGGRMHYVVVDSIDVASKIINELKSKRIGRATFIPLNKIKTSRPGKISTGKGNITKYVSSKQSYAKVLDFVFGETILMHDITSAKKYVHQYRMVTLDGELFELSGTVTGGRAQSGLSAKKKNDKYMRELETIKQQRESVYASLSEIRDNMNVKRRARAQFEIRAKSIETELKLYNVDDFSDKSSDVQKKIKTKHNDLEEVRRELVAVKEKISALRKNITEQNESIKKKRSSTTQKRGELTETISVLREQVASLKKEKNMLTENLNSLKQRLNKSTSLSDEKSHEKKTLLTKISKNEKKEKQISGKLKQLNKEMESLWSELREFDSMITELGTQKGNIERKKERISGELSGFEVQKATLETRIADLNAEYEDFKQYPLIEAGENRLQELMAMYEGILNSLGNVNLRAPEIYEEKKKEMDEIKERIVKLGDERKAVYRMIDEIEQRKTSVFLEVLQAVNNKFKELYSHLIQGDATLVLDNENKPFESGLRMRVTRNQKETYLESMSGGERTLLSVVLILSIQMVKPSPFYLLDEIDVSLDKVNSKLLSKLLYNMSKKSQFIVVTHNDEVLKNADVVLGVSRDKDSNSKVVGIKLETVAPVKIKVTSKKPKK
jgi:chromosome segregation protein